MCDDDIHQGLMLDPAISRRTFGLMTVAATGVASAAYAEAAIAQNGDMSQPDAKDVLKKTFADTGRTATVEVYPANHGWCVKDGAAYNEAAAERAWTELSNLYKTRLV